VASALRDAAFFVGKAKEHGEHIGRFAEALAASLPSWTRLRMLFKVLGLARKQAAIDRFTSNAYGLVIEGESYHRRLKPGQKPGQ